ncbi:hypothetical protein CV83915_3p0007 (plasmid) [Escherichia coli]|uniref:Uncharacterized protein n=1 Tax=Escherichia coli TaxID=562 RepID=A0A2H4TLB1_ECOLX|nr:hypothetical protein CV83915_3p0007 [Escherichia coli]
MKVSEYFIRTSLKIRVFSGVIMPQSGMEAPANDKYGTVAEWRRSPA